MTFSTVSCRKRYTEVSTPEALPHNRSIIGEAASWVPEALSEEALNQSSAARRRAAWNSVSQALRPIALNDPATGIPIKDPKTGQDLTIPAWQTWYELDEFTDMFHMLYWEMLSPTERQNLTSDPVKVDAVMKKFAHQPLDQFWTPKKPGETQNRFERLLGQFSGANDVHGINGLTTPSGVTMRGFSLFSPALIRHYLIHYSDVRRCVDAGSPVLLVKGFYFATCFGQDFPKDAVAVKTTWAKESDGVSIYDTSAAGIAKLFLKQDGTWAPAGNAPVVHPKDGEIYRANTFVDDKRSATFMLTGLHISTKETPHWLWTTLWWSPEPTSDFGEDRPALSKAGDGGDYYAPWKHYKMCTVSGYDEKDPAYVDSTDAAGRAQANQTLLGSTDKSLTAALKSAAHFASPNTFCSNPFLEIQPGFATTNCIGCHQHSGLSTISGIQRPDVARKHQTFMSDYLWSFDNAQESFRGKIIRVINDVP